MQGMSAQDFFGGQQSTTPPAPSSGAPAAAPATAPSASPITPPGQSLSADSFFKGETAASTPASPAATQPTSRIDQAPKISDQITQNADTSTQLITKAKTLPQGSPERTALLRQAADLATVTSHMADDLQQDPGGFSLAETAKNAPASLGGLLKGLGSVVINTFNPNMKENTVANLVKTALGGVQFATGGAFGTNMEPQAKAVAQFFNDRYGITDFLHGDVNTGAQKVAQTIQNDPAGFALDLASVMTGGGEAAAKAGEIANASKLTELGAAAAKVGKAIDPIQVTLGTLGKVMNKITEGRSIAPFGGSVNPDVVRAAQETGIDLPASVISDSNAVKNVESVAMKGLFGKPLAEKVGMAAEKLDEVASKLVSDTGGSAEALTAGGKVAEGFKEFVSDSEKAIDAAYQPINAIATKLPGHSFNTMQALTDIIEGKQQALGGAASPDVKFFQTIANDLADRYLKGDITFDTLKKTRTMVGEKLGNFADPIATGNRTQLQHLYASLSNDLDETTKAFSPKLYQKFHEAGTTFKQITEKVNSTIGKTIKRFTDTPDKIIPALFNPHTSEADVYRFLELAGHDALPDIQASVLGKIIEKAKGINDTFTPSGIARQIKAFGENRLGLVLTPEQLHTLKSIDVIAKALGKAAKITEGSQTSFIARLMTEGGAVLLNPLLGAKILFGDYAYTKLIGSPLGQKLLTSGFKLSGKLGKTVEKIGTTGTPARQAIMEAGRAAQAAQQP